MTASDADRAKVAEPLTALEWLRVTHADTLSGRRIEEAIAAERAAAVADLRARVEAVAEELEREANADAVPGKSTRDQVRAGTMLAAAARLRAAVTDTTGDPA